MKYVLMFLIILLTLNLVYSQEENLPPFSIGASDMPFSPGTIFLNKKQLWGNRNEVCWEVTKVSKENEKIIWNSFSSNGDEDRDVLMWRDGVLQYVESSRSKLSQLLPINYLEFPLEAGKHWVVANKQVMGKQVVIDRKVVEEEDIGVPAGIFRCLRIENIGGFGNEQKVNNEIFWIAPSVGFVKTLDQLEEKLTQIKELAYFYQPARSIWAEVSQRTVGPGKWWEGSGKAVFNAVALHPNGKDKMSQYIELSFKFTFTIEDGSGIIIGTAEGVVDRFENNSSLGGSWSKIKLTKPVSPVKFSFCGIKEGAKLIFYDGIVRVEPEKVDINGKKIYLWQILDVIFRGEAKLEGERAKFYLRKFFGDGTKIEVNWEATPRD